VESSTAAWRYDRERLASARSRGVSTRVIAPTVEPVPLDLFQRHTRGAEASSEMDLWLIRLQAAREYVERYTGRALLQQTWAYTVDALEDWAAPLLLPVAPVMAITSITVTDPTDTATVITGASYRLETGSEPARIVLDTDIGYWVPNPRAYSTLSVLYTAGYGTAPDDVPAVFRHVIMLLASEFSERLEAATDLKLMEVPFCMRLLDSYVLYR
jgi:uncharacterized phiE125 gp8 family phage protein